MHRDRMSSMECNRHTLAYSSGIGTTSGCEVGAHFCYIMAFWYRKTLRKLKTLAGQIFAVCIRTCYQYFPICIPIENKVNWFWSQRHFLSIDRIPGISRIYSTLFSVLLHPRQSIAFISVQMLSHQIL